MLVILVTGFITLRIYKVLKRTGRPDETQVRFITLRIYKVLKPNIRYHVYIDVLSH